MLQSQCTFACTSVKTQYYIGKIDMITFQRSGIDHIVPNGALIQEELFDPCGYSMNAFLPNSDQYATIHVTPEKDFSFASFETNQDLICLYKQTKQVIKCFRPGKLLMTVFANDDSVKGREAQQQLWDRELPGYKRTSIQFVRLECQQKEPSWILHLFGLLTAFVIATFLLLFIWNLAPPSSSAAVITLPSDINELKKLAILLQDYKDKNFLYTVILYGYTYVYKQTFAIPGSFFLNLLGGALFGVFGGSILVCILSSIGASGCFLLSAFFMRPIIDRFFSHRLIILRRKVLSERVRLFTFLVGARVLPFCPHWFMNVCSPFVDISLLMHTTTVLIGLIPYNVLCVRAGRVLADLRSIHDVMDVNTIVELLAVAVLFVCIGFFSKQRQNNVVELSHFPTK
ncbi:adenosylmethionine decarboxylase [Dictyocaulus viviparus]|uniref:Adenosylmethionine decarboxylase n=1 Tax=Dictyocaulus viviparus TaxID=29172 RepID=A0A0D8XZL4_DICVI|nr:adenosylmethionine decarboxylase [Dictyocaulus viviparus]